MSLTRTILHNVVSSWAGYAVHVVVAFLLTPYIIHSLGFTRYGAWALTVSLTGYYGLLDLGISGGIGQYLTRYRAEKNFEELSKTASTGFVALTACGVLISFCSLGVAFNASHLFQIPPDLKREIALVVIITGLSAALQCVFFVYSAVFIAVQRFDLSNGIGVISRVVSAGATLFSLRMGYGLVGLSIALAGASLLDYIMRWRLAIKLLPLMRISIRLVSRKHLGDLMKYGGWNLAVSGGVRLISYTDTLVIGAFMPISAVAPFAVAASLRSYFEEIFARAGFVFFPAATELDAQQNVAALQSLYLVSSKFMFLASAWCGSLALCWSPEFFRLWIGEENANPHGYPSIAFMFSLLLAGSIIGVGQRVGYQVLQGTRRLPLLATLIALEGVSNLVVSVILVPQYGLIGVALGTLIPALFFQGIVHPMFVCRTLQIGLATYCRQVLLRPLLVFLSMFPIVRALSFGRHTNSWMPFVVNVVVSGVTIAPVFIFAGLERTERKIALNTLQRVFRKLTFLTWRRVLPQNLG